MKKYFNKNIFKDKSFIKMICFTIVLIMVLVLGNTFGYVSASGNYDFQLSSGTNYSTYENYQNSSVYNSDAVNVFNITYNNDLPNITEIESLTNISYDGYTHGNNTLNLANCPNYIAYKNTDINRIHILFYGDGGVVSMMGGKSSFLFSGTSSIEWATVSVDTTTWTIASADYGVTSYGAAGLTDSNLRSYCGKALGQYCSFLFSNSSVYAPLNTYYSSMGGGDNCFLWFKDFNEGQHVSFVDVNYQVADGEIGGNGGASGRTAQNNMYADSADWYLSNFNGNIWSNYRTCSTVFTSNLNNYINDSLVLNDPNTDSNYTIDFDFQIYIDFYYSYCIGSSSSDPEIVLPDTTLSGSFVSGSIDDVNGTGEGFNDLFLWSCTYDAPASMGNYLSGMHIDASTFADNGYLQDFPLSALFAYMEPTNSYVINPNGSKSNISITLQQLMYLIDNGYIGRNNNLVSEKFEIRNFRLTCTANIEYGDFYDSVFHDTYESGKYSETFDLLTGDSYIADDSMLTNYYPYNENDSTNYSSLPSTSTYPSSGSNTISTSNGNVTQTVTVTNDGAQYIPSLISKLIPTSLGDTGTGLVSTFSDMAQTNGWISVMASTVPAIPSTIWVYLTNYLGISLYLLACAFVLRLILDLL